MSRGDDSDDYDRPYPIMRFTATVSDAEASCMPNGVGCVIPPVGAEFYPYFSLVSGDPDGGGQACTLLFGGFHGRGINDFGRDRQYGPSNLPWFFGENTSGPLANPCLPSRNNDDD